ncbi:MAG: helix-turn-helix transcriptional regulator [Treponema sp.]|nr:helix-turn-helix transcriptional regulator [Treponema sp.]
MTENEIRNNLARNIKTFRTIHHISQADLAERAEISIPFLSQIECANKFPSPAILAKISDALDVSVSDLFAEKEKVHSENHTFMLNAIKAILNGQIKSFENFCENYFEK